MDSPFLLKTSRIGYGASDTLDFTHDSKQVFPNTQLTSLLPLKSAFDQSLFIALVLDTTLGTLLSLRSFVCLFGIFCFVLFF